MMQFSQSGDRNSWLTKLHACANYGIQHPCGDHRDHARTVVHVDNASGAALLAISIEDFPPVKGVPTIVNLQFLPDMGRMSGELPSPQELGAYRPRTGGSKDRGNLLHRRELPQNRPSHPRLPGGGLAGPRQPHDPKPQPAHPSRLRRQQSRVTYPITPAQVSRVLGQTHTAFQRALCHALRHAAG